MGTLPVVIRLQLGASASAPGSPAPAVEILPGRDVGTTPYANWAGDTREVRVKGLRGADLMIEEVLLLDVKHDPENVILTAEPIAAPEVMALDVTVWAGDRIAGRLDLLSPAPVLALGPLQDGAVLGLGVRLKLAQDAQDVRELALTLLVAQ